MNHLSEAHRRDFLSRGFTRRSFGRLAALAGGAATLPFYNEAALAQRSFPPDAAPGAVMINANENPLGPCQEALEAMAAILPRGGRYMFGEVAKVARTLADTEGLRPDSVQIFAGSSDPLHRSVLAFTSPTRSFVTADPAYEPPEQAAAYAGAKAIRVPLTRDYRHDVKEMVRRAPDAGLFYVCNPNNPTGTTTPREDLAWLMANKPAGSVVLIDEAYLHFCDENPCTDWVKAEKDVIVLRTFSKIYGMAGLRAGAALARPALLEKLRFYGSFFLPITAMAGATASLLSKSVVPERKKVVKDVREDVLAWLDKRGMRFVPSVSNKFMLDAGRPGREMMRALVGENVYVGRVWPSWPNHIRVTIGTREEMEKFKQALAKVSA